MSIAWPDPLNEAWASLPGWCDEMNVQVEDVLYGTGHRMAGIRRAIWRKLYESRLCDQKRIARMFNVSQQAVSKALNKHTS
jgi:hypothetical protein